MCVHLYIIHTSAFNLYIEYCQLQILHLKIYCISIYCVNPHSNQSTATFVCEDEQLEQLLGLK